MSKILKYTLFYYYISRLIIVNVTVQGVLQNESENAAVIFNTGKNASMLIRNN